MSSHSNAMAPVETPKASSKEMSVKEQSKTESKSNDNYSSISESQPNIESIDES